MLASVAWQTTGGIFVAAILVGGTFVGLTALGLIRARSLAAGDPRRALAAMTVAFSVGQIVGPAVRRHRFLDRLGSFTDAVGRSPPRGRAASSAVLAK